MSQRSKRLKVLVTERLTAAAEEIFGLVERTIAEYEEELCRCKEENRRKQLLVDMVLGPTIRLHRTELVPALKQEKCNDIQIHEAKHVQVKEEGSEELPVGVLQEDTGVKTHLKITSVSTQPHLWDTSIANKTETHLENTGVATQTETHLKITSVTTQPHLWDTSIANKIETHLENTDVAMETDRYMDLTNAIKMEEEVDLNCMFSLNKGDDDSDDDVADLEPVIEDGNTEQGDGYAGQSDSTKQGNGYAERSNSTKRGDGYTGRRDRSTRRRDSKKRGKGYVGQRNSSKRGDGYVLRSEHKTGILPETMKDKPKKNCWICQREFSQVHQFKQHMAVHRGKPLTCPFCQKTCTTWNGLKGHIMLHTGELPFQCSICKKGFKTSTHLRYHLTTHTKKLYSCVFCGKAFRKSFTMMCHMHKHTGKWPFRCPHCEDSFKKENDLACHMLTHVRSSTRKIPKKIEEALS